MTLSDVSTTNRDFLGHLAPNAGDERQGPPSRLQQRCEANFGSESRQGTLSIEGPEIFDDVLAPVSGTPFASAGVPGAKNVFACVC